MAQTVKQLRLPILARPHHRPAGVFYPAAMQGHLESNLHFVEIKDVKTEPR
jgi:hypothetical protein